MNARTNNPALRTPGVGHTGLRVHFWSEFNTTKSTQNYFKYDND
jgi:hypothetical protein